MQNGILEQKTEISISLMQLAQWDDQHARPQ
jgi:hypothetical protein